VADDMADPKDESAAAKNSPRSDWDVAPRAAPVARGPVAAFLAYAWAEKVWWIVPMVLTLVSLFGLVWIASRQQVAPFFYAVGG
jgi:hypothetical protein